MTGKKKKCTAAIICILFVFVTFASLFYIVKEADHECTGENCPICACVHQAHQTLKNLGTGTIICRVQFLQYYLHYVFLCSMCA